uniref:TIL domain-containing protein n=1 Tax=Ditylenchus dipsaci TaxID=166011 RepID=A0A915E7E6_9BILA
MHSIVFLFVVFAANSYAQTTNQPLCGLNEEFTTCGTACEPSCSNPSPELCTLQCVIDVCRCVPGFVRSSQGCVALSDCPAKASTADSCGGCGPNEELCDRMCALNVCQCKSGYLRNEVGDCIPDQECNPCAAYDCPEGKHCEPQVVQCVQAPCPPLPNCVDNAGKENKMI